ncbi:ThiF family adenylyltransferase [Haloplasma contractile]|uniref:Dinucleotide-utilizing enzyme protein n=1 Tax=Haloplasma contractile SSD-17B TaxID=1033810 RepID=U2EF53_9MOLU|nr:ThiF family adenylyltransferase [Haloplasma contractile]ERJ13316.1 Dinucleotide-utilizing enzyme protein [Haloplasma contractile SSD-17B]
MKQLNNYDLEKLAEYLKNEGFDSHIDEKKVIVELGINKESHRVYFKEPVSVYKIPDIYYFDTRVINKSGLFNYGNRICLYDNTVTINPRMGLEVYVEVLRKLIKYIVGEEQSLKSTLDEIYDFWSGANQKGILLENYEKNYNNLAIINEIVIEKVGSTEGKYLYLGEVNKDFDYRELLVKDINSINEFISRKYSSNLMNICKGIKYLVFGMKHESEYIFIGYQVGETKISSNQKTISIEHIDYKLENYVKYCFYNTSIENVFYRGSSGLMSDSEKRITIVGCGSVGSNLINMLCEAGYYNFNIIDHDKLSFQNIQRHICNYNSTGKFKANAIKDELIKKYPYVKINAYSKSILQIDDISRILDNTDTLIITAGERNVEYALCQYLKEKYPRLKFMIVFVEPYLIAGHIIYASGVNPFDKDIFDDNLNYNFSVLKKDNDLYLREFGCSSRFVQYSVVKVKKFLYGASSDILEFINQDIRSNVKVYIGDLSNSIEYSLRLKSKYYTFSKSNSVEVVDFE